MNNSERQSASLKAAQKRDKTLKTIDKMSKDLSEFNDWFNARWNKG